MDKALSYEFECSYNRRDVLLYNLSVGATELRYVYELHPEFQAIPTFYHAVLYKGVQVCSDTFMYACTRY